MTNSEFLDELEARINEAKQENWKVTLSGDELQRLNSLRFPASNGSAGYVNKQRRRYVAKVRRMIGEARAGLALMIAAKISGASMWPGTSAEWQSLPKRP